MKVKELIAELQKLDPEKNLLAICEDDDIALKGNFFETFWVESVSVVRAEAKRIDVGEVSFRFGEYPETKEHIFINLSHKF